MSVCFFVPSNDQAGASSAEEENDHEVCEISDRGQAIISDFWNEVNSDMEKVSADCFKNPVLPLARIKKIMKLDEDVKMISGEAPVLFAKAAEIFIHELTLRAWIHTQDNKRRTLQRNDIAMAISKSDMFDFLIDIVPRQDIAKPPMKLKEEQKDTNEMEQVQYYLQLAQQHQAALQPQQQSASQQSSSTNNSAQQQSIQILQPYQILQQQSNGSSSSGSSNNPTHHTIIQQIMSPNGEVQQIPLQVPTQALNVIRMNGTNGQQVLIANPGGQQPQILQVQPQQNHQVFISGNAAQSNSD